MHSPWWAVLGAGVGVALPLLTFGLLGAAQALDDWRHDLIRTKRKETMKTLKLPGLSPAFSQLLFHALIVGVAAFGAQLVTNGTHVTSIAMVLVALDSAAAAGLTAVAHYGLGLIPTPAASSAAGQYTAVAGVSLKLPSKVQQILWSLVVVFLTTFGGAVAAGAVHATSVPTLWALVLSAGAAGVTAVVQAVVRLVPVPAPVAPPAPAGGSH